jgi:hypothetical protein
MQLSLKPKEKVDVKSIFWIENWSAAKYDVLGVSRALIYEKKAKVLQFLSLVY